MTSDRALPVSAQRDLSAFVGDQLPGPAAADESPFVIFNKVHRLLRGRYALGLALGAVGALVGAAGGYMATTPKFMSAGAIRVAPTLQTKLYELPEKGMPPIFTSYVRTQANLLQEPRVIDKAMRSPAWAALKRDTGPAGRDAFLRSLFIVTERDEPEWIRVRFVDGDGLAAKVAVEEVINAYTEIWGPTQNIFTPEMVNLLKDRRSTIQAEILERQRKIAEITRQIMTASPTELQSALTRDLMEKNREIDLLDLRIRQAEIALTKTEGGEESPMEPELVNAEIARVDDQMRMLLDQRLAARHTVARLDASGVKPAHRSHSMALANQKAVEQQVNGHRETWLKARGGMLPSTSGTLLTSLTREQIDGQKENLKLQKEFRDDLEKKCREVAIAKTDVEQFLSEIKLRQDEVAQFDRRLAAINLENMPTDSQATAAGRISVISTGEQPSAPYSDPRKKLAAVGFLVGGGIPFALLMLVGLMDKRYRYSDDATDSGPGHVSLLGILPNLPENMADPEQAAVAAHCVHQIRTLLQIGGARDDRRVFAITSPTSGDGKTSLALSLALSFAASGSRTLLIDFDLVGGGLTSAMQARTEQGLLSAIDEGRLNGHVRPTAFNRLSIVPAGENDAHDVSRLSPVLVRRILEQARNEYDTVIVDTGPILGSLEASLVAAESDAVILALGRGQQRYQVERAVNHLGSIGARLAGVVFNRARLGDFRRAVSSASVRSVPVPASGNGHHPGLMPAMGPMAATVATHIRSSGGGGDDL
ncbi:MAG: AAA family ATPase [Phycisphaerales bacterium]